MSSKNKEAMNEMTDPARAQEAAAGPLFAEGQAQAGDEKSSETASTALVEPEKPSAMTSETGQILSRPLYAIGDDYLRLVDFLTERGGEMDEESIAAWSGIQGEVAEKLENCALMVKTLTAHGSVVKEEGKRLAERAKTVLGRADRLKRYIEMNMNRLDLQKSEGTSLSVRIQDNAPSCEVFDLDKVPPEYVDVTITMTGVGWDNLQAVLKTVIPDQTDPDHEIDHWGGLWKVDRRVDKKKIVSEWRKNQGEADVAGTKTEKSASLRIY